jgi:ATP-dependent helicase/DNAse subunit B|tara:strand:- start:411 stop:704 length:294 start_codon:yes stop_codon:yes gene_type:complete
VENFKVANYRIMMEKWRDWRLDEEAASKSDINKMEKTANDIIKQMKKLNEMFKKNHKVSTRDTQLYSTLKDWESLTRKVSMEYGGWFDFIKDSEYIK